MSEDEKYSNEERNRWQSERGRYDNWEGRKMLCHGNGRGHEKVALGIFQGKETGSGFLH